MKIATKPYARAADTAQMETAAPPEFAAPRLDIETNERLADQRAQRPRRFGGRKLQAAVAIGAAFLAAAIPLALFVPSDRSPSTLVVVLLVLMYAAAYRIPFEVSTGSAVPTQLVLVPMLFMLPIGLVPLCVAAGALLATIVDHARKRVHLERAFLRLVGSWHAIGAVLVVVLAGEPEAAWEQWTVLVLALGAQIAFDFVSSAAYEWRARGQSPRSQLKHMGWAYTVDGALAPVGFALALAAADFPYAFLLGLPLLGLLVVFAREREERIDHALALSHAYRGTASLLGDVVEADDAYTGEHSRDVVDLVLAVCDELDLTIPQRREAEFAALLHDVGKIRIPSEIINKPGPLTAEERALINTHTLVGERMLARVGGLLSDVGRIVRSCHERWDGAGYPDGLAGEAIPLPARIVCACDAFNAMTTDRPYRKAMSFDHALEELRRNAGTQFDASVVAALIAVVRPAT